MFCRCEHRYRSQIGTEHNLWQPAAERVTPSIADTRFENSRSLLLLDGTGTLDKGTTGEAKKSIYEQWSICSGRPQPALSLTPRLSMEWVTCLWAINTQFPVEGISMRRSLLSSSPFSLRRVSALIVGCDLSLFCEVMCSKNRDFGKFRPSEWAARRTYRNRDFAGGSSFRSSRSEWRFSSLTLYLSCHETDLKGLAPACLVNEPSIILREYKCPAREP